MEHQLPGMRFVSLLAVCSALLFSCQNERTETAAEGASEEPVAGWPATLETAGGNYSVTLEPVGGEIVENEHFALDLTIAGKGAEPDSLLVKVDADMPAHQHGMNTQPELTSKGPLHYQVDGMLFHMAGEWVITVDLTRNGKTERASFPVLVE